MESDPLLPLLESVNGGKGVRIAREADIADSVACLRYYAGLADKPNGESRVRCFFSWGEEGVRGGVWVWVGVVRLRDFASDDGRIVLYDNITPDRVSTSKTVTE